MPSRFRATNRNVSPNHLEFEEEEEDIPGRKAWSRKREHKGSTSSCATGGSAFTPKRSKINHDGGFFGDFLTSSIRKMKKMLFRSSFEGGEEEIDDVRIVREVSPQGRRPHRQFDFPPAPPVFTLNETEGDSDVITVAVRNANASGSSRTSSSASRASRNLLHSSKKQSSPSSSECSKDELNVCRYVEDTDEDEVIVVEQKTPPSRQKPGPIITLVDESEEDEDEVVIVGEVEHSPKIRLAEERRSVEYVMRQVMNSSQLPMEDSPTSSRSCTPNSIVSPFFDHGGSPGPDDSVSRQVTPSGLDELRVSSTSARDRWSRGLRKNRSGVPVHKNTPLFSGAKVTSRIRHIITAGSASNSPINLSARDQYQKFIAEYGESSIIFEPPSRPSARNVNQRPSSSNNMQKYPLKRVHNALYVEKMKRILAKANIPETGNSRQRAGNNDWDVEVESDTRKSERPVSPASSVASSVTADRIEEMLSRCHIIDSTRATHSLEKQKAEYEVRKRHEAEINEEYRLRMLSRMGSLESAEESTRKRLELHGVRAPRPKVVKKEKDEFPELPPEAHSLCDRAWNRGMSQNEVFVEGFGTKLTRKDLLTLSRLDWLNDEVINFYMSLVVERSEQDPNLPKVYAFNTFFYPNIANPAKGYTSVKRWTRKIDIFAHDVLLVPVHLQMHWCMAVINFPRKRIDYYDSLLGSNPECIEHLKDYLQRESMDKKKVAFSLDEWEFEQRKDIPAQKNGSDCGMFACKFAEFASRLREIVFEQSHMPYFRKRMVYEIVNKKLL